MTADIEPRLEIPSGSGSIADQTGPLSFVGLANANVARMVVGDINAKGGLLGRPLELHVEDGATDDAVAAEAAARLVQAEVDVVFGGIYSSTRQAIKGPAVVEGRTLYLYPEQYEGQESDPLIFCTGPVPAQQVDPFIPWLMRETGARDVLPPVRRLHLAARPERAGPRGRDRERRLDRRRGVPPARPHGLRATVERIMASGADVVFNTIVPPGVSPFFEELYEAGFQRRGGQLVCTYFDENFLNMVPAAHVEGLYGCLDYYQAVGDPFSRSCSTQYEGLYPGDAKFTGGSGCSGLYRAIRLWAAAVTEAGTLDAVRRGLRARPRRDRRRPGRAGGDGARPASPAPADVHRAGARGPLRDRREPRRDRPAGARGRDPHVTA